jgi:hypothetical protein
VKQGTVSNRDPRVGSARKHAAYLVLDSFFSESIASKMLLNEAGVCCALCADAAMCMRVSWVLVLSSVE